MYRVLIADDEGIMRDALKNIITANYGNECELAFAKTGRSVVELAETFRPDIAFVDIQMPGINGIHAIREIRKFNSTIRFIIITAYDKFDYAKEAINLGVLDYLTKPVKKTMVLSVLERAISEIDQERQKRSDNLKIQEKLETVIPIVENGFVNGMLMQEDGISDLAYYKMLLDIQEEYAFCIVIQFGKLGEDKHLKTPVGMSVKAQNAYPKISGVCKEFFPCIVGPILTNRIVLVVRSDKIDREYGTRIKIIEQARNMVHKLETVFEAIFRAGIGNMYSMEEMRLSYIEAYRALNQSTGSVAHVDDLAVKGEYSDDYPEDLEREIVSQISNGNWTGAQRSSNAFFDWMIRNYYEDRDDIQLKVLEIVMRIERDSFMNGGIEKYSFNVRRNYMSEVIACNDYPALRKWFLTKLESVCLKNDQKRETQSESVISKAKVYIQENYARDLSLDEVSRIVNISPYYFSKLFKEESGQNFIEYLTAVRITHAKELLRNQELSIKEICIMSGYSDPNYFSRIFKKQEDITPSEYREQLKEKKE